MIDLIGDSQSNEAKTLSTRVKETGFNILQLQVDEILHLQPGGKSVVPPIVIGQIASPFADGLLLFPTPTHAIGVPFHPANKFTYFELEWAYQTAEDRIECGDW